MGDKDKRGRFYLEPSLLSTQTTNEDPTPGPPGWLVALGGTPAWLLVGLGLILAWFVHHFGLLRIVDRNLARILPVEGKRCLFSFQPWKSYLIILVMVGMGITLRHSRIPKPYLAVPYLTMGTALILSSTRYLKYFLQEL